MSQEGWEDRDIVTAVTEWLISGSGYSLEMATAAVLSKAGFTVVQGDYFPDNTEGDREVLREIDVTGYIGSSGSGVQTSVAFMVECKASTKHPWLLFTYPHGYSDTLQVTRRCATSVVGKRILEKLQFEDSIRQSPLFSFLPNAGHSVTLGMKKPGDKDTTYEALMSVCKASNAHVSSLHGRGVLAFDWPTIVIKAPLLDCHLDEEHEVVVKQIESCTLVWRNPVINAHSIIDIYTAATFGRRIPQLYQPAKDFAQRAWEVARQGV
jgi:hypothetical protein